MKHLKLIIIIAAIFTGINGYCRDENREETTTRLEQNEASQTENQYEVGSQPKVRVNQEMLDRFYEYKRNGSNIFLNLSLIQGHDYQMVKAIVQDCQTITLKEERATEYITQK